MTTHIRTLVAGVALAVVAITACSSATTPEDSSIPTVASADNGVGGDGSDTSPVDVSPTVVEVTSPVEEARPVDELDLDEGTDVFEYSPAPPVGIIPVAVTGGSLPDLVTSRYIGGGGQLVDAETFATGYGLGGLPAPVGVGSVLTDAESTVSSLSAGETTRDDALGFLFIDERPLVVLLDTFAGAVGVDTAEYDRTETVEDGGAGTTCSKVSYLSTVNAAAPTWTFSGCDYTSPNALGMKSLQVQRVGTFLEPALTAPTQFANVDTQVAAVADALGGQRTGWSFTFAAPDSGQDSTLTTSIVVTYPEVADLAVLQAALAAPLAGFTAYPTGVNTTFVNGPLSWTADLSTATLRYTSRVEL